MKKPSGVTLSILGVREDERWCAIALEMSLRGYGDTFDEALEDLKETIVVQVTYALDHHQTIDHIFIPAEPHYFERYAIAKRDALKNRFLNRSHPPPAEYQIDSLPIPQVRRSSSKVTLESVS